MQRNRTRSIMAQVVLTFEEAAKGAKRTIRVAQGVPSPQNVEVDIPAGEMRTTFCWTYVSDVQASLCAVLRRACGRRRRGGGHLGRGDSTTFN